MFNLPLMETSELISRHIVEIRYLHCEVDYEGSIPLEELKVELKLSSGEIVPYPFHPYDDMDILEEFSPGMHVLFPQSQASIEEHGEARINKIKNIPITGIWLIDDHRREELCALSFENGCFMAKGSMSPMGTAGADLFVFLSEEDLMYRLGCGLEKVF